MYFFEDYYGTLHLHRGGLIKIVSLMMHNSGATLYGLVELGTGETAWAVYSFIHVKSNRTYVFNIDQSENLVGSKPDFYAQLKIEMGNSTDKGTFVNGSLMKNSEIFSFEGFLMFAQPLQPA